MITEEEWDEVEDKMFMEKGDNPEPYQVCNRIIENLTKHNSSSKKDCYRCEKENDCYLNFKYKIKKICKFGKLKRSPS